MKRFLSISCMLLATISLTVFAVLPHHHHEGMICMIIEICDNHDTLNEEHPDHHHADDGHQNDPCILESDIIFSSNKEEIKCKVCICNNCTHIHHFPILFLVGDFLIYEELSVPKPDYGEFIVSYKPIDASQTHGLRAPPYYLL